VPWPLTSFPFEIDHLKFSLSRGPATFTLKVKADSLSESGQLTDIVGHSFSRPGSCEYARCPAVEIATNIKNEVNRLRLIFNDRLPRFSALATLSRYPHATHRSALPCGLKCRNPMPARRARAIARRSHRPPCRYPPHRRS